MRQGFRHALRITIGGLILGVVLFAIYAGMAVFGI